MQSKFKQSAIKDTGISRLEILHHLRSLSHGSARIQPHQRSVTGVKWFHSKKLSDFRENPFPLPLSFASDSNHVFCWVATVKISR